MAIDTHIMSKKAKLTMGPVLFNWQAEVWRDFYFRIADEAPVDTVYIGEVVCNKRWPFLAPYMEEVVERLRHSGKEVVLSSLALVMNKADRKAVESIAADKNATIEVNDISALTYLDGRSHIIGPLINCYNEQTLALFAKKGARRICLPVELTLEATHKISQEAQKLGVELELMAFGRMQLAVSARCYHARVHKITKDSCRFICNEDPDGLPLKTLDEEDFLTINGIQTMSYRYLNLIEDLDTLQGIGVNNFRLSPHSFDMIEVAKTFRDVLDGELSPAKAVSQLNKTCEGAIFSNGYLHNEPGVNWVD